MNDNDNELTDNPKSISQEESSLEIQEVLNILFRVTTAAYQMLIEHIPEEEKSDYALGNNFKDTLLGSSIPIAALTEDLEPYCAMLSLALSSRLYRTLADPDIFDPNLSDEERGELYGRVMDITSVTSVAHEKVEQIEDLEQRSARQTAILQICYLILGEAELAIGNLDGQGMEFITEAFRLPPIQMVPDSSFTFDQKLRMRCLHFCGVIEALPKERAQLDYVWDLSDRERLRFWAGLAKAKGMSPEDAVLLGNIPTLLLSEANALEHQSLVVQETSEESYSLDRFNDSLRELLEIVDLFRDRANEIDVPDADDPSASDPKGSAYWCWKLGQLVGTVAKQSGSVGVDNILSDRSWFNGSSSTHLALSVGIQR